MNKQNTKVLIFILLLLLLGYFREHTFLQLNAAIERVPSVIANQPIPEFLQHYTIPQLLKIKWIMLFLFTGTFFTLTFTAVHFCELPKQEVVYAYLTLLFMLIILQGVIVWIEPALYLIQRKILGFMHSPAIFVLSAGKNIYFKKLSTK